MCCVHCRVIILLQRVSQNGEHNNRPGDVDKEVLYIKMQLSDRSSGGYFLSQCCRSHALADHSHNRVSAGLPCDTLVK